MRRGFNNAAPSAAGDGPVMGDDQAAVRPPTGAPAGDEPTPNVTPEEQEVYEQVVANAQMLIYDKKSMGGIVESLKGDGVPIEGLANTAVMVAKKVFDSAAEGGVSVPGDVMFHAGAEIVEELADLQKEAGIADLSQEQIDGAFLRAQDIYREMSEADGTVDREAAAQDMQALVEADQAGRLDEVLPGASAAAQRYQGGRG
jgi:hypothetical protein